MKYIQDNRENVMEYEVDETGAMIYISDTEEVHVLNETAYFLYKSMYEPISKEGLYQRLESIYNLCDVDKKTVMSDIEYYLEMLCKKRLIRIIN